ncbi:TniQ family protein [Streptomyces sp. NPDC058525]|uniref:TniQ family protein n=1 Tax=Streptomyces sp. NPDC058525 TaxID=3346538 RepID=UPI003650F4C8
MSRPVPLPRSLVPLAGESLSGFLLRLGHRLDQSPGEIARRTGICRRSHQVPASHMLMLEAEQLSSFAAATRLSQAQVEELLLRRLARHYPPAAQMRPRGVFPPGLLGTSTRFCPRCLAGDQSEIQRRHGGPWQTSWRLAVVFACPEHQIFLRHDCSACQQPLLSRRLLPALTASGLHPAQCRSQLPGQGDLCGNRLDRPDSLPTAPVLSGHLLLLQRRILSLLDPAQPAEHAYTAFADLQFIAAVVSATWPAASTITAEPGLVAHLDEHIERERKRDPRTLTHIDRSNRWATIPDSPSATAALLDISSRLLGLPGNGLSHALTALLERALPPSTPGWGKTWSILRTDASTNLKAQVRDALPAHFPGQAAAASTRRRSLPPLIPLFARDCSYQPEHIPQWLPDEWFTAMDVAPSALSMAQSHIFRRFAALQMIKNVTDMTTEQAAHYLGIPDTWHQGPRRLRRLQPPESHRHRINLGTAFERLTEQVSRLAKPVDYRSRRLHFAAWTLPPADCEAIVQQIKEPLPKTRFRLDTRLHDAASAFIWAYLTGNEFSLAPSPRNPRAVIDTSRNSPVLSAVRMIRSPGAAKTGYQLLQSLLTEHAEMVLTAHEATSPGLAR